MRSFTIRFAVGISFFVIIIAWYLIPDSFFVHYSSASEQYVTKKVEEIVSEDVVLEKEVVPEKNVEQQSKTVEVKDKVKQSVPFVVQAPHAQWDDPKYQDACEEASLVMANAWIEGDGHISKNDAEEYIEQIFAQEQELFDDAVDTSASDTAKVFREYYGHSVEFVEDISMEEMYDILAEGHIIVAPTNGKWLNNPHFTNGGPERHMLVIIGFDRGNGEFITNDPGTRVGRGYKYKDSTLYNAIRDYKTGTKEPINETSKNVLVIKK